MFQKKDFFFRFVDLLELFPCQKLFAHIRTGLLKETFNGRSLAGLVFSKESLLLTLETFAQVCRSH